MRNPSKNTAKRIMRRAFLGFKMGTGDLYYQSKDNWPAERASYFLFNEVGAALWRMSKGQFCNREPRGYKKYLTPKQKRMIPIDRVGVFYPEMEDHLNRNLDPGEDQCEWYRCMIDFFVNKGFAKPLARDYAYAMTVFYQKKRYTTVFDEQNPII